MHLILKILLFIPIALNYIINRLLIINRLQLSPRFFNF